MTWPANTDYAEAIQNPRLNLADAELKQGKPTADAMGMPIVRSGNFADVYELRCAKGSYAVKCFTREIADQQLRYQAISDHLLHAKLPFTVDFDYQPKGILIKGSWFPILKMKWVEGLTLNHFVNEHVDKPQLLELLAQMWVKLAQRLRLARLAHADLQHGNVILVSGKTAGALSLKLIDYDGMFVPALANQKSGEVGHPNFQHPQRIAFGHYDAEVDRFAHLIIYTALRSLAVGGRKLWQKYDNGETLLFREADLKEPASSAVFHELWQSGDPVVRALTGRLLLASRASFGEVPLLEEVLVNGQGPALSPKQAEIVAGLLRAGATKLNQPPGVVPKPQADSTYGVQTPVGTTPASVPNWIAALSSGAPAAGGKSGSQSAAPPSPRPSWMSSQPALPPAAPPPGSPPVGLPPTAQARSGGTESRNAAILCAAFGAILIGLVWLLGIWVAPFWQATLVLAGMLVLAIGIGAAAEHVTDSNDIGGIVWCGSWGLLWWAAAWWWLESSVARIIFGIVSGICCLVFMAAPERKLPPNSVRYLQLVRGIVAGLALCLGLLAFFFRSIDRSQDSNGTAVAQSPVRPPKQGGLNKQDEQAKQKDQPPIYDFETLGVKGPILRMAVSPDGMQLLTENDRRGAEPRAIHLWDLVSGIPKKSFQVFPEETVGTSVLAFSEDGTQALCACNQTLVLVSLGTGKETRRHEHSSRIVGGAFVKGDAQSAFTAALAAGSIVAWDDVFLMKKTLVKLSSPPGFADGTEQVVRAEFAAEGQLAACQLSTGRWLFVNVATGRSSSFDPVVPSGAQLTVSPDGRLAASENADFSISVWDVGLAREKSRLLRHVSALRSLAFSPSGRRLLSSSSDGSVRLWDLETEASKRIDRAGERVLAFSPDGRKAVTGPGRWLELPPEDLPLEPAAPSPAPTPAPTAKPRLDHELLVVKQRDGIAQILHVDRMLREKHLTDGWFPAWSPDGSKIAFVSKRDGADGVSVMNNDGSEIKRLTSGRHPSWSPDGRIIAFERDARVHLMSADGRNVVQLLDGSDPAVAPNGKSIVFARKSGAGFLVHVFDGKVVRAISAKETSGSVYPAWSPAGDKIVWANDVGGSPRALHLFVANANGANVRQITKEGGLNLWPAWSPDGKKIAFYRTRDFTSGSYCLVDLDDGRVTELFADETITEGSRIAWRPAEK